VSNWSSWVFVPGREGVIAVYFTAERAASSLAGFQRGTLRAHADADADEPPSDPPETTAEEAPGPPVTAAGAAKTPTPPADRS